MYLYKFSEHSASFLGCNEIVSTQRFQYVKVRFADFVYSVNERKMIKSRSGQPTDLTDNELAIMLLSADVCE